MDVAHDTGYSTRADGASSPGLHQRRRGPPWARPTATTVPPAGSSTTTLTTYKGSTVQLGFLGTERLRQQHLPDDVTVVAQCNSLHHRRSTGRSGSFLCCASPRVAVDVREAQLTTRIESVGLGGPASAAGRRPSNSFTPVEGNCPRCPQHPQTPCRRPRIALDNQHRVVSDISSALLRCSIMEPE